MIFSKFIEKAYRSNVFARNDADGSVFYFSASDFEGLRAEPFSFLNSRGDSLNGNYYYYDGYRPDRLVIFDHGMGAGHRAYMKEIEMLARHGFKVFSYDHTGCSSSEGAGIRGLSGSLADLDDCIKAIKAEGVYSGNDISVVGHSWGGFSTMNVAAYHPDLHSLVAISGFISLPEMHKQLFAGPMALFRKTLLQVERAENGSYADTSAAESLRASRIPALIIHSEDDKTVSSKKHHHPLKEALSDVPTVEFILVDGKDHNPNYTAEAVKEKDIFFAALKKKKKAGELSTDEQKAAFVASFDWNKITEQDENLWQKILAHLDK